MAKTKKLPPKKSVKKNTKPTKKTAKIVKHNVSKNKKPIAKKVVKHSPKKTTQTLHNVKSTKTSKPISKKTASKSVNVSKKPAPVKTTKVSKPMTNKKVIKQKVVEELPLELKKTPKGKKEISIETKQLLQEPLVVTGDDIISIIRSTIAEIKEGKSGRKTITRKKLFGLIKTYVIDDETRSKIIDEFILANVELTGTAPTYDETTDTSIRDLINATSISKGTSSYSQRISNSYSYIASNIQGSNLLTPEEEKKYSKMILSDDPSIKKFARHKIILSNLKLVASYVNMYSGHGIDNNELFLEGVTGLNKALDKYDWKMGNKFSTYATYWIWQAITRTINENSRLIRVPTHLTTYLQAVNKKENELGNILGRQPSIRELSIALGGAAAGYSEEKISDARKKAANPISIDRVIRSDDESNFSDFLKDKSANPKTETENNFKSAAIQKFLIHSLTPEEKDIISRWYGLEPYDAPQKTDLIAKELGKSKDKIRQLFQKAMRKLKKPNSISKIKPYIEDNDSIED